MNVAERELKWPHLEDHVAMARAAGHPHPEWFEGYAPAGTDLPPRPPRPTFWQRLGARLRA
jgi:hypothetical protein